MFGYATDETEECMPLTVVLAHKLNEKVAELRRNGVLWWARPDTKTQVDRTQNYNMYLIFRYYYNIYNLCIEYFKYLLYLITLYIILI